MDPVPNFTDLSILMVMNPVRQRSSFGAQVIKGNL